MAISGEQKKIFYIGKDQQFWKNLRELFQSTYDKESSDMFIFNHLDINDGKFGHRIICKLLNDPPDILYLDFSENSEIAYYLARFLSTCNASRSWVILGLIDYLDSQDKINEVAACGIVMTHIKGGEIYDSMYAGMTMRFPNETIEPDFAKATLEEDLFLYDDFLVDYFTKDQLTIEGNFLLKEDESYDFKWSFEKTDLPSHQFNVSEIQTSQHHFNTRYRYQFEYTYAHPAPEAVMEQLVKKFSDPYSKKKKFFEADLEAASEEDENQVSNALVFGDEQDSEGESSLDIESDTGSLVPPPKALIRDIKTRLLEWIKANQKKGREEKNIKVFIIDKKMDFLKKLERPLDKEAFTFYLQDNLLEPLAELNKYRPHLIAFQFETLPAELDDQVDKMIYNNKDSLAAIFTAIQKIEDYNPFVVIFNNPAFKQDELRDQYEYAQTFVQPMEINHQIVFAMSQAFLNSYEKKIESITRKKYEELKNSDKDKYADLTQEMVKEWRYYPAFGSSLFRMSLDKTVRLLTLTESELNFICEEEIPVGSVFRVNLAIPMYITVVPKKATSAGASRTDVYRALIHSISEQDKQKLRRYVYSIFCIAKDEKRELEAREIEELKKRYLEAKDDEEND